MIPVSFDNPIQYNKQLVLVFKRNIDYFTVQLQSTTHHCLIGGAYCLKSQDKYFEPCLKRFSPEAKTTNKQIKDTQQTSPAQETMDRDAKNTLIFLTESSSCQALLPPGSRQSPSLVQTHPPLLFSPSQEVSSLPNQMQTVFRNSETMQKSSIVLSSYRKNNWKIMWLGILK